MNLQELMQRAGIWRAGELPTAAVAHPTGFQTLDRSLPGGGWPQSGLTEILAQTAGIGALRLLLPALSRLSQQGRWIIWVSPPHLPYSPALQDEGLDLSRVLIVDLPNESLPAREEVLWAYEQALRFHDCGAALLWLEEASPLHLRRLQLAAEAGATWAIVFRPMRFAKQSSPALLRLKLEAFCAPEVNPQMRVADEVEVTILKARGVRPGQRCRVAL